MRRRPNSQRGSCFFSSTYQGPKPGDFPIGSVQSRASARAMIAFYAAEQKRKEECELGNLTPVEKALIEDAESRLVAIYMVRMSRNAQERARVYGRELPQFTPQEIRHRRAIEKEVDRMTGGEARTLQANDSTKWNQLKAVAEENLRPKKK